MKKIVALLKLIGILIYITADLFSSSNIHNVHTNQIILDFLQLMIIIGIYAAPIFFLICSMKKSQIGRIYYVDDNIKNNFDFKKEYNSYTSKSYTEWKNSFPENKNIQINEEFRKFLIRKGKQFQNTYDCTLAVLVPFLISFLFSMKGVDSIDGIFKILSMVVGLVLIIIVITNGLYSLDNSISFFEDCVDVCDEQLKSKNKLPVAEDTGVKKNGLDEKNIIVEKNENANHKTIITITIE